MCMWPQEKSQKVLEKGEEEKLNLFEEGFSSGFESSLSRRKI